MELFGMVGSPKECCGIVGSTDEFCAMVGSTAECRGLISTRTSDKETLETASAGLLLVTLVLSTGWQSWRQRETATSPFFTAETSPSIYKYQTIPTRTIKFIQLLMNLFPYHNNRI
jgi:hypothetical protein